MPQSKSQLARGFAAFALAASVIIILFAGTFPFDFGISVGSGGQLIGQTFDYRWNPYDPGHIDRTQNILLFIPFGFSLTFWVGGRRYRALLRILIALLISTALSIGVETLQLFISFRDPSRADVWCNALGGALGAMIFNFIGDRVLDSIAELLLRLRGLAHPIVLWSLLTVSASLQLAVPLLIHNPGDLSGWNLQMPLVAGNEATGDRPWEGKVAEIILADRAATAQETTQLLSLVSPRELFGDSLIAHYRPRGPGPYTDLSGILPPLSWKNGAPESLADSIPDINPSHWLITPTSIEPAIFRIARTSEFTFAVTVASAGSDQRGPARLVSISSSPTNLNLQLGQEFASLSVRVRTAVRSIPDLYLRDVFSDTNPHRIVITHRDARIVIYIDGKQRGQVDITPEAKVIWRLYPRDGFRLWVDKYGLRSYVIIYRAMVFVPFCALLGAALAASGFASNRKRVIGIIAIVMMSIAIEGVLETQSVQGFSLMNLLISLLMGGGAMGIIVGWTQAVALPIPDEKSFTEPP